MSMLFTAPRSCLALVENFHKWYNQGPADVGDLLHGDLRARVGNFEAWLSDLRREHGAFLRTLSLGHALSPTSLTNLQVDLWLASEFERGQRQERFLCTTGLFVAARLLDIEIKKMQQPGAMAR